MREWASKVNVFLVPSHSCCYLRQRRRLCFWFGLFVCPSDYSQTCKWILTKFFVGIGHGSRTKWYNFGGDPDHASDPGVQSPKSGSSGLLKKLQTDLCHAVFGGGLCSLSASSLGCCHCCSKLARRFGLSANSDLLHRSISRGVKCSNITVLGVSCHH